MWKIANRDQWLCGICGERVDSSLFGVQNHPMAPSLDHIKFVAEGGSNLQENLQLAHRSCNNRRHPASELDRQLMDRNGQAGKVEGLAAGPDLRDDRVARPNGVHDF
jgi:5-methylcytosine-specific restriction endonuclease McrA